MGGKKLTCIGVTLNHFNDPSHPVSSKTPTGHEPQMGQKPPVGCKTHVA